MPLALFSGSGRVVVLRSYFCPVSFAESLYTTLFAQRELPIGCRSFFMRVYVQWESRESFFTKLFDHGWPESFVKNDFSGAIEVAAWGRFVKGLVRGLSSTRVKFQVVLYEHFCPRLAKRSRKERLEDEPSPFSNSGRAKSFVQSEGSVLALRVMRGLVAVAQIGVTLS